MSAGTQCGLDDRPTPDGARLCRACTTRLARDLDAVPELVADLLITVSRQDHVQATQPRRGGGTPLAFNAGASDELTDLRYYLGSWARCMAEDLGLTFDTPDTPAAHATWLTGRLRLIRHHGAADDLSTEIGHAVAHARRAVDVEPVASRFLVGPCPRILDAAFCDGDVLATITTTRDEPPTMACLRCEHVWRAEQWLRAGKQIKNRLDETGWKPKPRQRVSAEP